MTGILRRHRAPPDGDTAGIGHTTRLKPAFRIPKSRSGAGHAARVRLALPEGGVL